MPMTQITMGLPVQARNPASVVRDTSFSMIEPRISPTVHAACSQRARAPHEGSGFRHVIERMARTAVSS